MKTLGNILWHFPFFGFVFALLYALAGAFWCITVIGLPLGLGLLQFSKFLLSPFSQAMVDNADVHKMKGTEQNAGWKTFSLIVRILYFPFGLIMAVAVAIIVCCEFISIIGIPCGMVWAKSFGTLFNPVNKVCVPAIVGQEIKNRKDQDTLNKYNKQVVTA